MSNAVFLVRRHFHCLRFKKLLANLICRVLLKWRSCVCVSNTVKCRRASASSILHADAFRLKQLSVKLSASSACCAALARDFSGVPSVCCGESHNLPSGGGHFPFPCTVTSDAGPACGGAAPWAKGNQTEHHGAKLPHGDGCFSAPEIAFRADQDCVVYFH